MSDDPLEDLVREPRAKPPAIPASTAPRLSAVKEIAALLPPGVKPPKNLADTSEWQAAFSKWEANTRKVNEELFERKRYRNRSGWSPRSSTQDGSA